jgi:hypothetical protein
MTRKYGQRGYQEGERERSPRGGAPPRREPPPPRHSLDRPRGRGLGAPTEAVFRCAACGATQAVPAVLEAACEGCGAALHSCTHCQHFDSGARWECRQPIAARVARKSERNECAVFAPRTAVQHAQERAREPDDPRAAFDALFKL